jgi:hypothetical protein
MPEHFPDTEFNQYSRQVTVNWLPRTNDYFVASSGPGPRARCGRRISASFHRGRRFATLGLRGGVRFGRHELIVDAENLTDENYRGVSWGVDAPGRGIALRYIARF